MKTWLSKWGPLILGILLLLSFVTIGLFGYFWGKQKAQTEGLKLKEKDHLESIRVQDSIIAAREKSILVLTDSMNNVLEQAYADNARADGTTIVIKRDKNQMNEDIRNIPFLEPDSNVRLFNRLTDEYKPQ